MIYIPRQRDLIKDTLMKGEILTQEIALRRFNIPKLSTRISELKRKGLVLTIAKVRDADGKRITKYYMTKEQIDDEIKRNPPPQIIVDED